MQQVLILLPRPAGVRGSGRNHRSLHSADGLVRSGPAGTQVFPGVQRREQGGRKFGLDLFLLLMLFGHVGARVNVPLCTWFQKMEELLVRTKREKPTFIPYFVSACKELPGKFLLGYQPRGKPR